MTRPENPTDVVARFSRVNLYDCPLAAITVHSREDDPEGEVALDIILPGDSGPSRTPARLVFMGCLYTEMSLKFGVQAALGRQMAGGEANHPIPAEIKRALTTGQWVDIPDLANAVCFTVLMHSGDRVRIVAFDFSYSAASGGK